MGAFKMPPMHEFFLMHAKADRTLRGVVAKAIEKSSLTMTEWLALAVIAAGPREGLRMGEVAQALDVTLPQVTALVANLLDKKLCKQRVFVGDRRGRQVQATLKGKRTFVALEFDVSNAIEAFSTRVDPEQLEAYIKTTKQFSGETSLADEEE
jgi:DNA-binding MarR family transcriptional regulator